MSFLDPVLPGVFWFAITRLGESEILLPAFVAGALWLAFARPAWAGGRRAAAAHGHGHPARGAAWRWIGGVAAATAVTTASKIAFLGFGIGVAALDFTGFSGHSMYSMAILPVLGAIVFGRRGALAGAVVALVVMVSRVEVHAHSWSEALSGLVLGAFVAWWTLSLYLDHPGAVRVPLLLPIALACWLTLLPWRAPPSQTHGLVVALSLKLSGRTQPYTRHELLHGEIGRVATAAPVLHQSAAPVK
jgi:membrane-associated phospholipid phosphatase